MREGLFQLLFYTQIGIGIAAVSSTGSASPFAAGFAFLSLGIGLWLDARQFILLPVRYAKFVFAALAIFFLFSVFVTGNGWFYTVLDTLLLVTGVKLISPKANRDYLQIVAIGFLLTLASSILTTDALFSFYFVTYIFFLCWTLMIFTVKVVLEGDENPLRSPVATRQAHLPSDLANDLLDRRLFLRSALVILFVMTFTVLFFMFFPRFGAGLIGGTLGLRNKVSGMSNTVRFDNFSKLKPDSTIVVRIIEQKGKFPMPAYLRGKVLDRFENGQWTSGESRRRLPFADGIVQLSAAGPKPNIQYRILASDLGVQAIPVLAGTRKLRFGGRPLWGYGNGTAERSPYFRGAFAMEAWAAPRGYLSGAAITDVAYAGDNVIRDRPVASDAVTSSEGVQAVAMLLAKAHLTVKPATDPTSTIAWLTRLGHFLRTRFVYTLVPPRSLPNPLSAFVDQEAGHCEYFATVFVLAARSLGLPARMVTGFAGGERSTLGDYIFFRNSDAHSWTEVYFKQTGWLMFDPTPPYTPTQPGLLSRLMETIGNVTDLYQLWWINRVVNYDTGDQRQILERVSKELRGLSAGKRKRWIGQLPGWLKISVIILIVLAILLVGWLIGRPDRRSLRDMVHYSRLPRSDRRLLRKVERTLRTKRQDNETWLDFMTRTEARSRLPEPLLAKIDAYLTRRYRQ